MHQPSRFTCLPREILDAIAFELATLQPLGPPYILLPLLTTCTCVYNVISPPANPRLWARILRYKFDVGAVQRRSFIPTQAQCVEQLVRYCRAMQLLRSRNWFQDSETSVIEGEDMVLNDALMVGVIMMLEDDGANVKQLCEWAHADLLVDDLVRHRMFEEQHSNHGWPVANTRNSCALWLMWMFTSEERLRNEPQHDRDQLDALLLPFATFSYRYPICEAPPQYFRLPFSFDGDNLTLPTTIPATHGTYPVWPPPDRAICEVHYATRPILHVPLVAQAARLLFFARHEMRTTATPPHLAKDREDLITRVQERKDAGALADAALERGTEIHEEELVIGVTRQDLEEFNWGWSTTFPLKGSPRGGDATFTRGAGDVDPLSEHRFIASDPGSASTRSSPIEEDDKAADQTYVPYPRWVGKAPQPRPKTKSALWDADWWRLRLCGDPEYMSTRVPYGKVYKPHCMDGFWQGKMLVPNSEALQDLLMDRHFPGTEAFREAGMDRSVQPFYVRFREAHSIVGCDTSPPLSPTRKHGDFGSTNRNYANMNNAWFDGAPGSTHLHVRRSYPGEVPRFQSGIGEDAMVLSEGEVLEIDVSDVDGVRRRRKVFLCEQHRESLLLGNDATEWPEDREEWKGYEHDENQCAECQARARIRRRLEKEAQEERERWEVDKEALFASIGLGLPTLKAQDRRGTDEDDAVSTTSYSTTLDELETPSSSYASDEEGEGGSSVHEYPVTSPPRTHDRSRLASGACDGIREIFLIGETDGRHRDAWGGYEFYGRVRAWDGLIAVLRRPKCKAVGGGFQIGEGGVKGNLLFYGYLVGGENWVGSWRYAGVDSAIVGYEGAFVMSRRLD